MSPMATMINSKDLLLLLFFDPNGSCVPVGRVMTPLMAVERG